jgi:hypothetical protein
VIDARNEQAVTASEPLASRGRLHIEVSQRRSATLAGIQEYHQATDKPQPLWLTKTESTISYSKLMFHNFGSNPLQAELARAEAILVTSL